MRSASGERRLGKQLSQFEIFGRYTSGDLSYSLLLTERRSPGVRLLPFWTADMQLKSPRSLAARLTLLLLAVAASPVVAAENPLGAVPDTVSVVMRFRKPKATIENAAKFAGTLDMKFGQQLRRMSNSLPCDGAVPEPR